MRTIRIKLYKFNELSKAAKQDAILREIADYWPFYFKRRDGVDPQDAEFISSKLIDRNGEFTQDGTEFKGQNGNLIWQPTKDGKQA